MAKRNQANTIRQAKKPLFAYVFAYCLVRDLTEEEALEDISKQVGISPDTIRACYSDLNQFNQLPTGVSLQLCQVLEQAIKGISITYKGQFELIPKTFEVSDLEVNLNKMNWFNHVHSKNKSNSA